MVLQKSCWKKVLPFPVLMQSSLHLPTALPKKRNHLHWYQKASNLSIRPALVVYTAAIREDNEEFKAAVDAGIPMLSRAELLGQIMDNYEKSIAVAGTHGKTTTTSMISQILLVAKADPTISVGGILESIGGNIRVGGSEVFITDANIPTVSCIFIRNTVSSPVWKLSISTSSKISMISAVLSMNLPEILHLMVY